MFGASPTQYADDSNLRARQRLWDQQDPPFDLVSWVLDVADVGPATAVLDVGCGNGRYVRAARSRGGPVVACDLSFGMVEVVGGGATVNADVVHLPFPAASFDVVLAPHMLYHVPNRPAAAAELRRVLRRGGCCVAVTNGTGHLGSLRTLIERAVRPTTPEWRMRDPASAEFSLENGAEQLAAAFETVDLLRPEGVAPAVVDDVEVVIGYVASVADMYGPQIDAAWGDVVTAVAQQVQAVIDRNGAFEVRSDAGAFVCR